MAKKKQPAIYIIGDSGESYVKWEYIGVAGIHPVVVLGDKLPIQFFDDGTAGIALKEVISWFEREITNIAGTARAYEIPKLKEFRDLHLQAKKKLDKQVAAGL